MKKAMEKMIVNECPFILKYDKKRNLWQLLANKNIYFENDVVEKLREEPRLEGLVKEDPPASNKLHFECALITGFDGEKWQWEVNLRSPETRLAQLIGILFGEASYSDETGLVCQIA